MSHDLRGGKKQQGRCKSCNANLIYLGHTDGEVMNLVKIQNLIIEKEKRIKLARK